MEGTVPGTSHVRDGEEVNPSRTEGVEGTRTDGPFKTGCIGTVYGT